MTHPIAAQPRSPFRSLTDAIINATVRALNRIAPPERDFLDVVMNALPMVPPLMQALRPPAPVDLDGPKAKQVRRELEGEEAHLRALFAEKQARLIASFGPRFDEARNADDAAYAEAIAEAIEE